MNVHPFIVVDNCKEEIYYYRNVLGGEVTILRTQGDEVLNADLHVEGATFKFADTQAAQPAVRGDYVRVFAKLETESAFRNVYEAFGSDGTIVREAYEAPFNGLLGVVADRNGVHWVLSYYR